MQDLDISSDISGVDDNGPQIKPRESSTIKRPSHVQIRDDDNDYLPPIGNKYNGRSPSIMEEDKEMAFKDKPIQLVKVDPNIGKFQLCEQGLKVLRGIEGNIGIIAFAGLYRTGKSFTLNLLLDKLGKGVHFTY